MPFEYIKEKENYKFLSNGKWLFSSSGKTIEIQSKTIIGRIQNVTKKEIDITLEKAKSSQEAWYALPVNKRAEILNKAANLLEKNKEILSEFIVKEVAKPRSLAVSEVLRTADLIRATAEEGLRINGELLQSDSSYGHDKSKIALISRVPFGVVLAISPFNYPINLSVSKIAPALISGNSVVLKPSTQGAISVIHMCELFMEAGLPPGVLSLVTGKSADIGDYLVSHKLIDMIAFTGSTEVGKRIVKLCEIKPLLMELGGKDAALILEDADIDLAVSECVKGAFSYSGQRCTAIKRIIIMENIADVFIKKFVNEAKKLKVGNPEDDANITPLINKSASDYIQELVDDANKNGAKKILCDRRDDTLWGPSIFDNVNKECRLYYEEQFGPLTPIIRIKSEDEGIKIINDSEYGLECCIFTKDTSKALKISEKINTGTIQINGKSDRGPDNFPFSCIKNSGLGTQGIRYSIEAMTRIKSTIINFK